MAFPVFALTVYQDRAEDPGGGGGGNPDNPLVRPLDTEQGSWFGQQFPMLNLQMMNELEHAHATACRHHCDSCHCHLTLLLLPLISP